jgi:hypothetical protein
LMTRESPTPRASHISNIFKEVEEEEIRDEQT